MAPFEPPDDTLFSLISIRERRVFWSSWPSFVLALALTADGCVGVLIATIGLGELAPLPLGQTAFVIGYALIFSLMINDPLKIVLYHLFKALAERSHKSSAGQDAAWDGDSNADL